MFDFLFTTLRQWRRRPGHPSAVLLILSLGVGASLAFMTVANGVLLKSLPYDDEGSLVHVNHAVLELADGVIESPSQWSTDGPFVASGLYASGGVNVGASDWTDRVPAAAVSSGFFDTLAGQLPLGRGITRAEQRDRERVVVVGHSFWRTRFGGDPNVIGKSVLINARQYSIVGILPERFNFPDGAELFLPLLADRQVAGQVTSPAVIARLKPTITALQAREALVLLSSQTSGAAQRAIAVVPLREYLTQSLAPVVLLVGMVSLVLLVLASVTAGHLTVAHAVRTQHDWVVRLVLGADRGVLLRESLYRITLLVASAAVLAMAIVRISLNTLRAAFPSLSDAKVFIEIDFQVVGWCAAVAVITWMLVALTSVSVTRGLGLLDALRTGYSTTEPRVWRHVRTALAAAELALAAALLYTGTVLWQSVDRLTMTDPGFDPTNLITMQITLPATNYPNDVAHVFSESAAATVRELDGVLAAGVSAVLPGTREVIPRTVVRKPEEPTEEGTTAFRITVSADYFQAMGVSSIAGRLFSADDTAAGYIAVISKRLAIQLWHSPEEAVGRRITLAWGSNMGLRDLQVVGVVEDMTMALGENLPQLFIPSAQWGLFGTANIAVRVADGVRTRRVVQDVSAVIQRMDSSLPIHSVQRGDELLQRGVAGLITARLINLLVAVVALGLAACGVGATVIGSITSRYREICIRMSLGADASRVAISVVASTGWLAGLGLAVGLPLGYLMSRVFAALVNGIETGAVVPTIAAVGTVLCATVASVYVPVRRIMRLQPAAHLAVE
jgi:predicted permease